MQSAFLSRALPSCLFSTFYLLLSSEAAHEEVSSTNYISQLGKKRKKLGHKSWGRFTYNFQIIIMIPFERKKKEMYINLKLIVQNKFIYANLLYIQL